jgi:hypothetical protein
VSKTFNPGPRRRWRILLKIIIQSVGVNICTVAICPVASCFEHGNEHSLSILWCIFLTICVTKSFLRRSGVTFHFAFPHACCTQLNSCVLLSLTCCCVIFSFRELFGFLMAGPAGFGAARDVTSMAMGKVTVPLVTAVTNWSAMVPEEYLRSPWLR